jgi:hypothetical protein
MLTFFSFQFHDFLDQVQPIFATELLSFPIAYQKVYHFQSLVILLMNTLNQLHFS